MVPLPSLAADSVLLLLRPTSNTKTLPSHASVGSKWAVTDRSVLIVTVRSLAPVPVPSPDQREKRYPVFGLASAVKFVKELQSTVVSSLTVPPSGGDASTVSVHRSGGGSGVTAKWAVTDRSLLIVTVRADAPVPVPSPDQCEKRYPVFGLALAVKCVEELQSTVLPPLTVPPTAGFATTVSVHCGSGVTVDAVWPLEGERALHAPQAPVSTRGPGVSAAPPTPPEDLAPLVRQLCPRTQ